MRPFLSQKQNQKDRQKNSSFLCFHESDFLLPLCVGFLSVTEATAIPAPGRQEALKSKATFTYI